jgi:hypothetical protein
VRPCLCCDRCKRTADVSRCSTVPHDDDDLERFHRAPDIALLVERGRRGVVAGASGHNSACAAPWTGPALVTDFLRVRASRRAESTANGRAVAAANHRSGTVARSDAAPPGGDRRAFGSGSGEISASLRVGSGRCARSSITFAWGRRHRCAPVPSGLEEASAIIDVTSPM